MNGARTEISSQDCFCRVWSPFPIDDRVVGLHDETEFLVPFRKRVISSLCLDDGILPLSEEVVAVGDMGSVIPDPGIDLEDGLTIHGRGGYGASLRDRETEMGVSAEMGLRGEGGEGGPRELWRDGDVRGA